MTRARRKPSLPPLVRYQLDMYDHLGWVQDAEAFKSLKDARNEWAALGPDAKEIIVIRRLSDGRIVWRNRAAKEVGY